MLTLKRNYMKVHGPPVTLFVKFYYDRDVTRISSCWGNTTSRPGIKQLGISSIAALRLFSSTFIVAEGNPWPLAVNDSPAMNRITRWLGFILEPCCQRGYCLS